jgi:hypothetical protein
MLIPLQGDQLPQKISGMISSNSWSFSSYQMKVIRKKTR